MHNESQCEDAPIIRKVVVLDKNIDETLINHANECETFLFWLSFRLAASEAYHKGTNRIHPPSQRMRKNCPERPLFERMLSVAIECVRKTGTCIEICDSEQMLRMVLDEMEGNETVIGVLRKHFNDCVGCSNYFESLYFNMIALQKKFENRIEGRETIRPEINDGVREIVWHGTFNFAPCENQKPN